MRLTLSTEYVSATISFEGRRLDPSDFGGEESSSEALGSQYNPISLASPVNNSMPHFTFVNGTEIQWRMNSRANWRAESSAGRVWRFDMGIVMMGLQLVGWILWAEW